MLNGQLSTDAMFLSREQIVQSCALKKFNPVEETVVSFFRVMPVGAMTRLALNH